MKALINTKSNFRNLNGQWLKVLEIVGTRVSCKHFAAEIGREITIDFALTEIKELR